MPADKTGPLTQAELYELWLSSVDKAYSDPLVSQPDSGIELVEQNHAQLARVSLAVDRTFQSFYILPWSGQTAPPAGGPALAVVELVVSRSGQGVVSAATPLIFTPNLAYDHAPIDFSEQGPVQVLSGRRYFGAAIAIIGPGELGPVDVTALSERPFAGYNLPLPNTITVIDQQGAGLFNDGASVVRQPAVDALVLRAEPDVLGPQQVGQYVLLTAGSNAGRARRIVGFQPPGVGDGGTVLLAAVGVLQVSGVSGAFIPGEVLEQPSIGVRAIFLWGSGSTIVVDSLSGSLSAAAITGTSSGATATVVSIDQPQHLTPESGTAAWRVLDWADDLGVEVTNPASPSGGQTPMLDSLGAERNVLRASGEPDDQYRERVSTPADVVSPNAIRRAINRPLAPYGVTGCLREVGQANFRGMFYDGDPTSADPAIAFAYDLDFDVRPADRFKLELDYVEFRAFMLVGVPTMGEGEFGIAYDEGPADAYDALVLNAYDGFAAGDAALYRAVWNAVNLAKAGGVGFDIYREDIGCT